jgi:hypothetical protein
MGYVDLPLDWHTSLYSIPGATPLKTILTALALSATATRALAQTSRRTRRSEGRPRGCGENQ